MRTVLTLEAVHRHVLHTYAGLMRTAREATQYVINTRQPCPSAEWTAVGRAQGLREAAEIVHRDLSHLEQMLATAAHEPATSTGVRVVQDWAEIRRAANAARMAGVAPAEGGAA